jgi:hypothetical protein
LASLRAEKLRPVFCSVVFQGFRDVLNGDESALLPTC